ncbi:MAG: DUF3775 domain-containing protein [Rhodomicrobium sp.]
MLKALTPEQVRFVAVLAKTARAQRDSFLGKVEDGLVDSKPARGEHDPTAELGFDPVTEGSPQIAALREAIAGLKAEGRSELFALMRIGQGDLAVQEFCRGTGEAATLGDETVTASLIEDPDLHDHLMKALYEAKLVSP